MATTIYSQISNNKIKTWLIMFLFVVFFFSVSFVLGKALGYGLTWTGTMLIISGLISFISYYHSDKIVLAISGAKPADKAHYHKLHTTVENLAIGAGIPIPKIYVVQDPSSNAFATGRNPQHAVVCATTGLLSIMDNAELEGVIGHELSHIKNYDTRLMGVVAILIGSIAILANLFMRSLWLRGRDDERNQTGSILFLIGIIFAVLSPIIATLIQLAISRRREYLADANSALLTRFPDGLASALEKISQSKITVKQATTGTAHLYIANPFKGKESANWLTNLFSTHPPIADRIKILRAM